jgi:hypothetical protein
MSRDFSKWRPIRTAVAILYAGVFAAALTLPARAAHAKTIRTNEVTIENAPDWLKQPRVEKVTDHIQMHMEWTTRRTPVVFYASAKDYTNAQKLGPLAIAVTQHDAYGARILLGPHVNEKNFDEVFGHELVHVIVFQKYKDAIPKWLEEGLANYLSTKEKINYGWMAKQPFPKDVHDLAHPFNGSAARIDYRYKASQAFAEMLDKKCGLQMLINLSVQRKMEDYMRRTCEIKDLNAAFHEWVMKKAKGAA